MVERFRHPELVSGSISPPALPLPEWMLKQVQHDEGVSDEMLSDIAPAVHDAVMIADFSSDTAAAVGRANFTDFAPDDVKLVKLGGAKS